MQIIRKIYSEYKSSFAGINKEVWWLSLVMLINRSGAMVIPFMSLYLTTALEFTLSQAGFVMGAYGLGSILGAFLGGELTDKFGSYRVQLVSLTGGGSTVFTLIFLESFESIVVAVFLFALISDTLRPANSVAVSQFSEENNRVRSFSLMRLAINLGFSIGPALGGLISGMAGFKWIFLVDSLTCFGALFILKKYIPSKQNEPDKKEEFAQNPPSVVSAYRDYYYLIFIGLVMLYGTIFFQFFSSIPVFWKIDSSFNEISIGLLLGLNGLLIALFEMPLVRWMQKRYPHHNTIPVAFGLLGISYICLMLHNFAFTAAVLFIVLLSVSEMLAMPFMLNFSITRASEVRKGQYMALYSIAYGLAHIAAPVVGMRYAERFGFDPLFVLLGSISVLGTISFWLFFRRNKKGQ